MQYPSSFDAHRRPATTTLAVVSFGLALVLAQVAQAAAKAPPIPSDAAVEKLQQGNASEKTDAAQNSQAPQPDLRFEQPPFEVKRQLYRAGEVMLMAFDNRDWVLTAMESEDGQSVREYVLQGQDSDSWTEMLSTEFVSGDHNARHAMRIYAQSLHEQAGKHVHIKLIEVSGTEVIFEWTLAGHDNFDNQHELVRIVQGKSGLFILHYVKKQAQLDGIARRNWLQRLRKAKLLRRPAGEVT